MDAPQEPVVGERICKICHCGELQDDPLVSPCLCKGSMGYIHPECLFEWIKSSNAYSCGICRYKYRFRRIFREGTPCRLPAYCVFATVLRGVWSLCRSALGLCYFASKVGVVVVFNSCTFAACVHDFCPTSTFLFFLCGMALAALNYLHSFFFQIVRAVLGGSAGGRTGTRPPARRGIAGGGHAWRTDSDEGSLEFEDGLLAHDLGVFTQLPTPGNARAELAHMCTFLWYSAAMCFCNWAFRSADSLFRRLYRASASLAGPRNSLCRPACGGAVLCRLACGPLRVFSSYASSARIGRLLLAYHFYILYVCAVCLAMHHATLCLASARLRVAYYFVKAYLFTLGLTIYSFFFVGLATHVAIYRFVNHGVCVVEDGHPMLHLVVYTVCGLCISRFLNNVRKAIVKSLRPGLITSPFNGERTNTVVRYTVHLGYCSFARKYTANLLVTALVPVATVALQSGLCPVVRMRSALSVKIFFVFFSVSGKFGEFMVCIYARAMRLLFRAFGMENYVYNTKTAIADPGNLVWGLNTNAPCDSHACHLEKMNRAARDARRRESVPQAAEEPPDGCGAEAHTEAAEGHERRRAMAKYAITKKRIERYYGVTHGMRYSIFYRPRLHSLYRRLVVLACFALTQAVLSLILGIARAASRHLPEEDSAFLLVGLGIARALSFAAANWARPGLAHKFLKSAVLHLYSNLLVPSAGTLFFMFLCHNGGRLGLLIRVWTRINSLSCVSHAFVSTVLMSLPVDEYSYGYILRLLASFAFCKLVLVSLLVACTRILGIKALLGIIATFFACSLLISAARQVLSGSWAERIRDEYFLKKRIVVNYTDTSDARRVSAETIKSVDL